MKILITTGIYPPDIGGSASYSYLLEKELPQRGFEIAILTYGNRELQGQKKFYVSKKWPKGVRHIIYFFKILSLGRKRDLILAADSSFGAAFISAVAAKLLRKKFIVRITGDYAWEQGVQRFGVKELLDDFQNNRYGFFVEILRNCQKFTVKAADKIIVPSKYLKKIVSGWGVDVEKIKLIYNSVELPELNLSKQEARSDLNLQGRILVSVGRLVPWKGFNLLIEILPELLRELPDLKLVIVGDGPELNNLQLTANNLQLKNKVIFTKVLPKNKLIEYLKAADIFMLNTAYEGFSHQIIEAMSFGLPIITTAAGGNAEAIENGKNGILGDYNNPAFFKQSIKKLIQDQKLMEDLGREAKLASENFSKEMMIKKIGELLRSI